MYAVKPLIIAALAATASATYFNGEALRREVLEVRETLTTTCETTSTATISSGSIMPYPTATVSTNSSGVCSSVLAGLSTVISGLPTATGALQSYLATAASTLTDPCVSLNLSTLNSSPYKHSIDQNLSLVLLRTLLHRHRLQHLRILRNILLQRPFITIQLRPPGLSQPLKLSRQPNLFHIDWLWQHRHGDGDWNYDSSFNYCDRYENYHSWFWFWVRFWFFVVSSSVAQQQQQWCK